MKLTLHRFCKGGKDTIMRFQDEPGKCVNMQICKCGNVKM